jgi:hypothetical protein
MLVQHYPALAGSEWLLTLNRLSWRTRLMAASSLEGESFVWNTTPKDPFPTILHCVYWRSLVSPVIPSWTFSRTTSAGPVSKGDAGASTRAVGSMLTSHPQVIECCRAILSHLESCWGVILPLCGQKDIVKQIETRRRKIHRQTPEAGRVGQQCEAGLGRDRLDSGNR